MCCTAQGRCWKKHKDFNTNFTTKIDVKIVYLNVKFFTLRYTIFTL